MANRFILFAEDDSDEAELLRLACGRAGFAPADFHIVRDGLQAVRYLESAESARRTVRCPSHVITDVEMPLLSGLQLLCWIRAHPEFKALPVTLLTKLITPALEALAREGGCHRICKKPAEVSDLVKIILECANAEASRA